MSTTITHARKRDRILKSLRPCQKTSIELAQDLSFDVHLTTVLLEEMHKDATIDLINITTKSSEHVEYMAEITSRGQLLINEGGYARMRWKAIINQMGRFFGRCLKAVFSFTKVS